MLKIRVLKDQVEIFGKGGKKIFTKEEMLYKLLASEEIAELEGYDIERLNLTESKPEPETVEFCDHKDYKGSYTLKKIKRIGDVITAQCTECGKEIRVMNFKLKEENLPYLDNNKVDNIRENIILYYSRYMSQQEKQNLYKFNIENQNHRQLILNLYNKIISNVRHNPKYNGSDFLYYTDNKINMR